jgi:hypothetical protein
MTATTDIVSAIVGHHSELQTALSTRVDAVVDAARPVAPHEAAVAELRGLLEHDIIPHARAEEEVLYAAASAPTLTPLVTGMIFEHETLLALSAALAAARTPVDAAIAAAALRAVFIGHVRRENDLLLPALAADPEIDLPALLPRMQERMTAHQANAS